MSALHDPQLERRVTAYLLAAPAALRRVPLEARDLGDVACATVLGIMRELDASGVLPTSGRVQRELQRRGARDVAAVALDLVQSPHGLADVEGPAEHLRDLSERRRVREPLLRIAAMAERGELAEARAALETLSLGSPDEAAPIMDEPEIIRAGLQEVERRARDGYADLGLRGLRSVAHHMVPGFLTIVGGPTNAGKSQLSWLFARRYAEHATRPAGIISCEDMAYVYADRTVAYGMREFGASLLAEEGVTSDTLEAAERMAESASEDPQRNLQRLAVVPDGDIERVIATMRAMVRCEGCSVLVVDYLSRLRVDSAPSPSLVDRVYAATPRIKAEAMRLGVPVILVSQLNRNADPYREPSASDLLGGAVIEQTAECICLIWKQDEDDEHAQAKLAKKKVGRPGGRASVIRNHGGMIYDFGPPAPRETKRATAW